MTDLDYKYRVGSRRRSHRKRKIILGTLVLVIVLLLALGWASYKKYIRPNSILKQSAAVVSVVAPVKPTTHTYDLGIFTIALPINWQQVAGNSQPYHIFRFEGGLGTPDEQQLEIYQDTIPQTFAVNEVLSINAAGDRLGPIGEVSDNCTNFTKNGTGIATAAGTPAKWMNINFLCDLNNPERGVVGTSSTDGINTVILTGPKSGSHAFFFSYTDNSIAPDYTDFYSALASFRLK